MTEDSADDPVHFPRVCSEIQTVVRTEAGHFDVSSGLFRLIYQLQAILFAR